MFQVRWYKTQLPKEVVDMFLSTTNLDGQLRKGTTSDGLEHPTIRDSKVAWITPEHWIAGFCYHYVLRANEDNFHYKINTFGRRNLQYTSYSEGEHYKWHVDDYGVADDNLCRKLSFSLQLSDPEDYSGGELEFLTDSDHKVFAPKTKGSMIIFDSRLKHRVRKVKSGVRKSLVGWVPGPAWQ